MDQRPIRIRLLIALVLAGGAGAAEACNNASSTGTEASPPSLCPCTFARGDLSVPMGCGDRGCFRVGGRRTGARCTEVGLVDDEDACATRGGTLEDGGALPSPGPRQDLGRPPETATCEDDAAATCAVSCPVNAYCSCQAAKRCTLDCHAASPCVGAEVDCSEATSAFVDCSGVGACGLSLVVCGAGGCDVTCSGTTACDMTRVVCGDGPCRVDCSGEYACLHTIVRCGKGLCRVSCSAPNPGVLVDCGDSRACLNGCN